MIPKCTVVVVVVVADNRCGRISHTIRRQIEYDDNGNMENEA
jgi:hypothetical protein